MKKVLVIAYYFPPTGGGGVQRTLKFVKYLPFFDWKPVVLTARNPDFDLFDRSLLEDIPKGVNVYRTYSVDPIRCYRVRRYGPNSRFEPMGRGFFSGNKRSSIGVFLSPVRLLLEGLRLILNNFVLVPDDYIGWLPFALFNGLRVIRKEKIDVIYATGKPWVSFLIALWLRLLTRRPYVLDLRDPWTITPYDRSGTNRVRRSLEGLLERLCFSHAEKVININEQISRAYTQHYTSILPDKFTFITHGFDQEDFVNVKGRENEDRFTLSYVGTVYRNTLPDNLLKAVKSLISQNPGLRGEIRLRFVGHVPSFALRMIDSLGLDGVVETTGYLPHKDSIQHMVDSHALVLLLSRVVSYEGAQVSTGKLFEYLASRRPILALIPVDTDAAKLIRELEAGKVIDPEDVKGIENTIYEMYREYKNGELKGHTADIRRFDRKRLTGQLANILNSAITPHLKGGERNLFL